MRELKNHIRKELPPIQIYLDEVSDINNILKENCEKVVMSTEKYELDDLSYFNKLETDTIHTLAFKIQEPYISIQLTRYNAIIFAYDDSTQIRGIVSKLEEVLRRGHRKVAHFWTSGWGQWILILPFSFLIFESFLQVFSSMGENRQSALIWFIIALLTLGINIWFWVFAYRLRVINYSTIILCERKERKNFFFRNKDQLLLIIITVILTALCTVMITLTIKQ